MKSCNGECFVVCIVAVVQLELRVVGSCSMFLVLVVISLCEVFSAFLERLVMVNVL